MITEMQVQESIDYLFETALTSAQARANRHVLEHGLRRVKSLEMQKVQGGGVAAAEAKAYASDAYGVALEGLKEAIQQDEGFRALRDAHAARIEAWRTQSATVRSVRL
jgi:hypothetical protein